MIQSIRMHLLYFFLFYFLLIAECFIFLHGSVRVKTHDIMITPITSPYIEGTSLMTNLLFEKRLTVNIFIKKNSLSLF